MGGDLHELVATRPSGTFATEDVCSMDAIEVDEKLWSSLPQALVEEVIARLPLKVLFQCRALSRAWKWGARPTSRKRQSPQLFEKMITNVSSRWPTYCPVYLFQEGLVGYNSATNVWEKVFDLRMFPYLPEGIDTTTATCCAGSLVCFASVDFSSIRNVEFDKFQEGLSWHRRPLDHEIYVVNVVTKKWKILPPRSNMQRPNIMHLITLGPNDYEIILLTQLEHTEGSFVASTVISQIYHSASESWTVRYTKRALPKWRTSLSNFVYLEGVFYIATGSSLPGDPPLLMTHNVKKGTWTTIIPPLPVQLRQLVKYHVLLCGSDLILVVRLLGVTPDEDESFYSDVFIRNHAFLIFKLDLASGQISELSRCPREKLVGVSIDQVLAFGDSIYFGGRYIPKTPMMIYNVRKQEWTYHTSAWKMPTPKFRDTCWPTLNGITYSRAPELYYWTHYSLQPGLNPFAEL